MVGKVTDVRRSLRSLLCPQALVTQQSVSHRAVLERFQAHQYRLLPITARNIVGRNAGNPGCVSFASRLWLREKGPVLMLGTSQPPAWASHVDWGFMNFLACIFDSLDVRRDGDVSVKTFLLRLCGYDPMPPLPQEARETLERSEEDSSAWQTGTQRRPGGFAELRPGVVRLTGAGYIGRGNAPEPRTPILTAEQEELILKMNVQVHNMLAVFPSATGRPFTGSIEDLDSMLRVLARHSGSYHRREFLEKLIVWKLTDSINARGIL